MATYHTTLNEMVLVHLQKYNKENPYFLEDLHNLAKRFTHSKAHQTELIDITDSIAYDIRNGNIDIDQDKQDIENIRMYFYADFDELVADEFTNCQYDEYKRGFHTLWDYMDTDSKRNFVYKKILNNSTNMYAQTDNPNWSFVIAVYN